MRNKSGKLYGSADMHLKWVRTVVTVCVGGINPLSLVIGNAPAWVLASYSYSYSPAVVFLGALLRFSDAIHLAPAGDFSQKKR